MSACIHAHVRCVNNHDIIRKYQCEDCAAVMMCSCDGEVGRRCLGHQLDNTRDPETGNTIQVTDGFAEGICNACRGLPEEAHPMKAHYRRTGKFVRYYWREIQIEALMRFEIWAEAHGYSHWTMAVGEHRDVQKRIDREVIEELKSRYEKDHKYDYADPVPSEVISKHGVELIKLTGEHATRNGKLAIIDGTAYFSPEEFAGRYFASQGYKWLYVESVPFHTLFGVFMWMLIEDLDDERVRPAMFGDRNEFELSEKRVTMVTALLPDDFGKPGYYERRRPAIEAHLNNLRVPKEQLQWMFDYWAGDDYSGKLRQYLWAHRERDVVMARRVVEILPEQWTISILEFLVQSYWARYLGWPDLLVHRGEEFFFAEVKSSRDKLSGNQLDWIQANDKELHLPFKLVKIHRPTRNARGVGTPGIG